ncbi:hypothetical protein AMTR_s00110p00149730 [Amborella trichopoda]|uniref:Uncharacterized protein n=2 Tax=Amborella trichopoda TaxID=13333 RepID=W1NXJ5_AMBTC|nr:hypothetical protein AMTR_s00110p00149730 [Amborella trichopoda]
MAAVAAVLLYFLLRPSHRNRGGLPLPPTPGWAWPVLGHLPLLGLIPHHSLAALAKKHGPHFLLLNLGTTSPTLVVSSPAAVRSLLKSLDPLVSSRPPNAGATHMAYNYQDLVFAPYGPRWRLLRKLCNVHLFSQKALDHFSSVRESEAQDLVSRLSSSRSAAVTIGPMLTDCTTNALGRTMLGRRVFVPGEGGEFREMVLELMVLAGVFNIGDFVPELEWLDLQGVVKKMKRLHKRFDDFFERMIEENSNGGEMCFLGVLMALKEDADGEGSKISRREIKALLMDLFTAGTDTSSSTVEWAIAELIRHPSLLDALQLELDSVAGRDRLVLESDLPNLTLLQAIIKEIFRLHPSTPLLLPRIVAEDCEAMGYHIPKDTRVLINAWAISRDPDVWKDPLEFKPVERFMPGAPTAHMDVKGNDFEFIPFGAGRRICAGMSMGIRNVQFLTAALVHAFDWELLEGETPEKLNMEEVYGLTLQRKVPLVVKPKPRLAPHVYANAAK